MAKKNIEWCISELPNLKLLCDNIPVTKETIISFLDILISNAHVRTGIPKNHIKEYNKKFYANLEQLYKDKQLLILTDNNEFRKLCLMFKVPVINNNSRSEEKMNVNVPMKEETNTQSNSISHLDCLNMFNNLSLEEKLAFIKAFKDVKIELSPAELLKLNID